MVYKDDPEIGLFYNVVEDSSIALMVHDVAKSEEEAFIEWQRGITRLASRFPGYQRTLLFAPKHGAHAEWVISMHFEKPGQLDDWLNSEERNQWLKENKQPFSAFKVEKVSMGLEHWFKREEGAASSMPPDWRMVVVVTLGLYPTMILLTQVINPALPRMSLALSMLIGNFYGVAALQWVMMPLVNWTLGWWMAPVAKVGWLKSVGGLAIIGLVFFLVYQLYLYAAPPAA